MTLAIKYIFFAIIATGMNIGAQYVSLRIYRGQFDLYVAMFWGTLIGLIVKYLLDKRYIFRFKTNNLKENSFKFVLYSLMGVITTLVFWGVELGFNAAFPFDSAKYLGAVTGLSIGYLTKYQLDKRYVFICICHHRYFRPFYCWLGNP